MLGRVKPELAYAYHARKAVWLADLDLDLVQALAARVTLAFRLCRYTRPCAAI